jgi:ankyrin repeat protein
LHIAVAYGNIKAVNFAIKFNQQQKAFNFDSVGGERQWTLLHYAIEFTNLQMVTALLNVTKQFFTTDINGKTAMEMCPYSSPIYKLIRARSRT